MDNNGLFSGENSTDQVQNNQMENGYQQPTYQNPVPGVNMEMPMTVGEWFLTLFVLGIPCVGIIMAFVWAFGSTDKKSRTNFCRAMLIWSLIGIVLSFIFMALFGSAITNIMYYM